VFIYDRVYDGDACIICIISFHVDDDLGTSNSCPFLSWVKGHIDKHFGIKDLGPVCKFLGIQFERDQEAHQLWMHQGEYISYLLHEYSLLDCNLVLLPLDTNHPFGHPSDTHDPLPNLPSHYQKLIGELLYLSICTHPDISFTINSLAQHNANPSLNHYTAAKCLLCYLSGTINVCLHYGGDHMDEDLHAYLHGQYWGDLIVH
jgi:hypothetical protein